MDTDNAKTADERASWYVMALYTKKQYNAIAYHDARRRGWTPFVSYWAATIV